MNVFKDLFWFFKQEKKYYLTGIVMLFLVSLLTLIPPYVVGVIVDRILEGSLSRSVLIQWLIFLLVVGILTYILRYVWRIMIFGPSIRLGKQLRNQLYVHFNKMSPQFYQKRRVGDLMAHSTNDVQAVEATAGEGVLTLVDSLTMGGMVVIMMALAINFPLTLIVLLPMPLMAWATGYYGKLLHERFFHAQSAFSDLNDKVQENVSGVRVIKAFGQEADEKESFRKQSADVVQKNVAVAKVDSLFDPTISFIVGLSYILAISFGSWFVVRETITLGELVTFTMYLGMLIWPMLAFGFLFNIVERGRASYDRIRSLLSVKEDITDKENAIVTTPSGNLAYSIQSYSFPESDQAVLRDIQFRLEQGETLGIVGKTGSGKTTLLRLLLREFDCKDGDMTIGGTSIYDFKRSALRSAIGYVPQEHFLFSATLAENIAFGKAEATMAEIKRAAQIACIDEDIERFPEGYNTVVGERGVTLSGGQKQRISIARAILLNPEILILDDSLSAVDAKTEETIVNELRANRANKTTIISAHRLSAIEHADLIIVLEDGRIAERGTHEELLEADQWYAMMYRHQQLESLVAQGGGTA
ncbi:ABC transporter transmembrane domain-containing protein [Bacillus horti]|uniref:ATP-binding cassette subfamily B protein n=1 Tax=Caldalkalibacillus horti TaxID=77523 RepID=A0ABT9VX37_9BACI|nr:ABC transporter transmembrane domain-containing protein [Bacillus horti]MDQ0165552.1 ATP-binding cassette subfamily B protein [Bacillus horti]